MTTALAKDIPVEKTEFGPGKTPLYYNNVGLFSDPFLEDRLPNLEKYYNHASTKFLNDFWNIDESDAHKFNKAYQDIMDLWHSLDQDVPKFCDKERQLQNRWIDKIFEALGWTIELEETVSRHGKNNYPDYGLYKNFDDWKKSRELSGNKKFKKAVAVADAKDWGVNLDGKGFSNKNPSFQIINYLKQTDKTWGILTDGRYWRIYSVRSESKHTTYFEIDLIKILAAGDYERFKYFYNFFRVEAFVPEARLSDRCFLDFVFEDGRFYSQRVEQNLQERVYRVVDTICSGFLENYNKPTEKDLDEVYEYSMYYLFKLMFVLNCESKGLLEVNKQDDYYEFSLRKKCLEIKDQFEEGKNWSSQPRTYNYIKDLFNLLKEGDSKIGVHGFGVEPFEVGSLDFFNTNRISDEQLNNALLELSCDYDEDDNFQFIDYKILSPDHIGSLFEGLLEFKLTPKGKKIELLNTSGERRATGSYYTPDYMVDHIVQENLKHFVDGKMPGDILDLKVLDPSVGSGHFLLGAVKYLENYIVELQDTEKKVRGAIDFDKIRKEVIHNCIFGVDINPLAAQLAKFSLWIYSAQKGDKLEPLADQIKVGNSLISFDWEANFEVVFEDKEGFDSIIGNPPYARIQTLKEYSPSELKQMKKDYISAQHGNFDLYTLFFEKGHSLLNDKGLLSFITPNTYQMSDFGVGLREFISNSKSLYSITDFKQHQIFDGASTYSCITTLSKGNAKTAQFKFRQLKTAQVEKKELDIFKDSLGSDKYFEQADIDKPTDKAEWSFSASGMSEVMATMKLQNDTFDNVFEKIFVGTQTGNDKIFVLDLIEERKKYYYCYSSESDCNVKIEKDVGRLFFLGKDIGRYQESKANRVLVYPYSNVDTKTYKLIDKKIMQEKYPNCFDYLNSHKSTLEAREKGKYKGPKFYQFSYPKSMNEFEKGPKLMMRNFSYQSQVTVENSGELFFTTNIYGIRFKNATARNYYLALMNSNLCWAFIKSTSPGIRGGYHQYKAKYIKPMPVVSYEVAKKKYPDHLKKIESLVKKVLKRKDVYVEQEIDNLIYEIYGLTKKQIAVVEDFTNYNEIMDNASVEVEAA